MTDEIPTGQLNKTAIDEFLARPLLARLATANPATGQPHVVPLWYGWDGTSIWISSFRSTRKIRELQKNPRCSIVIDMAEEGKETKAVILEGEVELFLFSLFQPPHQPLRRPGGQYIFRTGPGTPGDRDPIFGKL
jgi:hypothetical protein